MQKDSDIKNKCSWTTAITDELQCSLDGEFDDLGFPVNKCPERKTCGKRRQALADHEKLLEEQNKQSLG